jgi:hypothetical protein
MVTGAMLSSSLASVSEPTVISDRGGLSRVINHLSPTPQRGFKLELRTPEWELLQFPSYANILRGKHVSVSCDCVNIAVCWSLAFPADSLRNMKISGFSFI